MTAPDRHACPVDPGARLHASLQTTRVLGAGPLPTTRLVLRPARDGHYEILRHTTYTARERRHAPWLRNRLGRRAVRRSAVDPWITRLRQARISVLAHPAPIADTGRWTLCLLLGEQSIAYACIARPTDEAAILERFGRWLAEHAPPEPEPAPPDSG